MSLFVLHKSDNMYIHIYGFHVHYANTYLRQSYINSNGVVFDVKTYLLFEVIGMSLGMLESYVEPGFQFFPYL